MSIRGKNDCFFLGKAHWTEVWQKSPFCTLKPNISSWSCFNGHAIVFVLFLFFLKSLTFAWIVLSGFQSTGNIFLFCFAPNFCLDRPFGFSIHRDAHFCLSRPFGFSTQRAVLFCYIFFAFFFLF